ncbi:unnamed protein product [Protopolystoma xenopodis]|uniref:Uncharacterized protein n=1 Tax=Protopolystoma xenopodis TaxID=117903 RepID=A0A3S5AKY4_9PLAT|nr:unnamed protein product [Protopolystoma xenopodis]
MARLTDDADYDAGETSENVSSSLSDAGNQDNYYGRRLRTPCVLHSLPEHKTKLQQRGQPTSRRYFCCPNYFEPSMLVSCIGGHIQAHGHAETDTRILRG